MKRHIQTAKANRLFTGDQLNAPPQANGIPEVSSPMQTNPTTYIPRV